MHIACKYIRLWAADRFTLIRLAIYVQDSFIFLVTLPHICKYKQIH